MPWCYLAWLLKLSDILLGFSSTSILSIERTSSGIWSAWPLVRSSLWLQFTSVLGESSSYVEKKSAVFVLEATRYSSWDVTSSVLPSKPLVEELLHLHHWQINLWSLYRMPLFRLALLVISQINLGTHILVAGLSLQVASLFVFSVCCLEFLCRVNPIRLLGISNTSTLTAALDSSASWLVSLNNPPLPPPPLRASNINNALALSIATAGLFIRTVFRFVKLSGGFTGNLANS